MYFRTPDSLLASFFFSTRLAFTLVAFLSGSCMIAAAQEKDFEASATEDHELVERPQPGVTLLGKPDDWQELRISSRTAVSPDGKFLAAIQDSRNLIVMDRSTQEVIQRFPLQVEHVYAISFSPSGNRLGVVGYSNTRSSLDEIDESSFAGIETNNYLYIFDQEFEIKFEIEIPAAELDEPSDTLDVVYALKFSPDEKLLIASGQLASHWIDLNSEKVIQSKTMDGDLNVVFITDDLVYFPRRKLLWNRLDNSVEPTKYLGELAVSQLQSHCIFHPTMPLVAYSDRTEKQLFVKNWADNETLLNFPISKGAMNNAAFSMDGKRLATTHRSDGSGTAVETTMNIFDLQRQDLVAHATIDGDHYYGMTFADRNELILQLYSTSGFATVHLDKSLETVLRRLSKQNQSTSEITVNHDATWAVIHGSKNWVNLANGNIHKLSDSYSTQSSVNGSVGYLLRTDNTSVSLTEVETAKMLGTFDLPEPPAVVDQIVEMLGGKESRFYKDSQPIALRVTKKNVCAMVVLSNGFDLSFEYVAWNLRTQKSVTNFKIHDNIRYDVNRFRFPAAISGSGEIFAYATSTHLKVMNAETEKLISQIAISNVDSIQFSHDEALVAVGLKSELGNRFNVVQIFDLKSAQLIKEFREENLQFTFAEDSPRFAISSVTKGSPVQVFNTENWNEELTFATQHGQRSCMALSGDGKHLIFGLTNSQIEVWDLKAIIAQQANQTK